VCAKRKILKMLKQLKRTGITCFKELFLTCNGSGQTLGVGVAVLTTVVNASCYEAFSSTGKADSAQPHMATGVPETKATMRSPQRQMIVSETEGNIRDTEHFGLWRLNADLELISG
jgi:hypothetical protein